MKIYISEKYLDLELLSKSEAVVVGSDFDVLSPMGADGGEYVLAEVQEDTEVQTIEQHEAEIKAPLLEEIEKLKTENYHLKQILEFGKISYASLQEQLQLINKANKYVQDLVFEHRRKERREVINELLEWSKNKYYRVLETPTDIEDEFNYINDYEGLSKFLLIEKLNEMKGESL